MIAESGRWKKIKRVHFFANSWLFVCYKSHILIKSDGLMYVPCFGREIRQIYDSNK